MYPDAAYKQLLRKDQKDVLDAGVPFLLELGAPVALDDDRYVTSTNMKVGAYTIAAQPDVARNVVVTRTADGNADTGGTITVTGTNILDDTISEVITVGAHSVVVAGTKAFKTITSIVGAGWVIDGNNDTIKVGCGNEIGLPLALDNVKKCPFGMLDFTIRACATTITDPPTVEGTTIDMNGGTYADSKIAWAFVRLAV
jgi:hypothetical protein